MAENGLTAHPKVFGAKILPEMKVPADPRLLRDIKLHEIPAWLGKRNFSPLGMYFWAKRFKHSFHTKYFYTRRPGGNVIAMQAVAITGMLYLMNYPWTRMERHRKYH